MERKMSLKAFLKQYLIRLNRALLVGIICAVVLAGYKGYSLWSTADTAEESFTDAENEIQMIEKNLVQKSLYLKESPQASMDPYHEAIAFVYIQLMTDALEKEKNKTTTVEITDSLDAPADTADLASALVERTPAEKEVSMMLHVYSYTIKNTIDWEPIAQEMGIKADYIPEVVGFASQSDIPGQARITIRYKDVEGAEKILDYYLKQLQAGHDTVEQIYGAHEFNVLGEIRSFYRVNSDKFGWLNSRVSEMNNLMNTLDTYKTATASLTGADTSGKAIAKTCIKNGIYGFVGGLILYFIVFLLWCVSKGKVLSAREMNEQYGIAKIAAVPPVNLNEGKGLKKRAQKLDGDYYSNLNIEKSFALATENLKDIVGDSAEPLAVISDLNQDELEGIAGRFITEEVGRPVIILANPDKEPGAIAKLRDVNRAILVARTMTSSYNRWDEILRCLSDRSIEVQGSIVV